MKITILNNTLTSESAAPSTRLLTKFSSEFGTQLATLNKLSAKERSTLLDKAHRVFGTAVRNWLRKYGPKSLQSTPTKLDDYWKSFVLEAVKAKRFDKNAFNAQELYKFETGKQYKVPTVKALDKAKLNTLGKELSAALPQLRKVVTYTSRLFDVNTAELPSNLNCLGLHLTKPASFKLGAVKEHSALLFIKAKSLILVLETDDGYKTKEIPLASLTAKNIVAALSHFVKTDLVGSKKDLVGLKESNTSALMSAESDFFAKYGTIFEQAGFKLSVKVVKGHRLSPKPHIVASNKAGTAYVVKLYVGKTPLSLSKADAVATTFSLVTLGTYKTKEFPSGTRPASISPARIKTALSKMATI